MAKINWAITDWLSIAYDQGTSSRAPALFEIYQVASQGYLSQTSIDPCFGPNCPSAASPWAAEMHYYENKINESLTQFGEQDIVSKCCNATNSPTASCNLFTSDTN